MKSFLTLGSGMFWPRRHSAENQQSLLLEILQVLIRDRQFCLTLSLLKTKSRLLVTFANSLDPDQD